jgi:hypothetical protein
LHQAGRGYGDTDIGPVYSVSQFVQRGHGIGSVLTGFWRWINPILWSGAKTLSRESMRTGCRILADLAQNTNSDVTPRDIVAKYLCESVERLLSVRGRKRKRNATTTTARSVIRKTATTKTKKQKKKPQIKEIYFHRGHSFVARLRL